MKNFTRFAASIVGCFVGLGAFAQYDLAVTSLSTVATSSGQIAPNTQILMSIGIENIGIDIPENTKFSVIGLNGTDTVSVNNDWTFVNGDYPTGGTGFVETNFFTLPAAPPNASLCGVVIINLLDDDSTNNIICEAFTVSSSANTDLEASALNINNTTGLEGFDIYNGNEEPDNITDVNIEFTNVGNTIFPAGFGIPYEYSFEGFTTGAVGTLTDTLGPGGTTVRPSVNPDFAIDAEVGTYKMCGYTTLGDADLSNDTLCVSFSFIDKYIPPPPIGIEEDKIAESIRVFNVGKNIWFNNLSTPIDVTITDASGKVVASEAIINDGNISLDKSAAGVYIVRTRNTENGATTMSKLAIH
jgi:hypothetical protein